MAKNDPSSGYDKGRGLLFSADHIGAELGTPMSVMNREAFYYPISDTIAKEKESFLMYSSIFTGLSPMLVVSLQSSAPVASAIPILAAASPK
ncbi:hypothetical protein ACLMJK_007717 [Lecanora helva]